MFINQDQTRMMVDFLENEHFRYRHQSDAAATEDEIDLSDGYAVDLRVPETPMLSQMLDDFRGFMDVCMGVSNASRGGAPIVSFGLAGEGDPEGFRIEADAKGIGISAPGERGLLHASHYLEKQFAFRGGPFLRKGIVDRSPAFSPRITNTVFGAPYEDAAGLGRLSDSYLSLLSHFGVNGLRIGLRLWDYCRSDRAPELSHPERDRNVENLNALSKTAARHGIDLYAVMHTGLLGADAEVFVRHPDMKGAPLNYDTPSDAYCLCSSNPKTLGCYEEAFADFVNAVPLPAGLMLIVGGEGFVHCFTRPKPPLAGGTSCPACAGKNPSAEVANLVNVVASAVHRTRPDLKVFAWPYSAFAWSGEDLAQTEFIANLNDDVLFLSNFDTPHTVRFGDSEATLVDYNIVNLGPSDQFKAQSRALEKVGKKHYAKWEDAVEPGWFSVPYLPVHYRWIERIKRMKEWDVPGYMSKWEFYGFTGSMPEEILSEMTWQSDTDPDELLMKIARRDFGEVSDKILRGWRALSDVWPRIPASHMIYGEREFYMKGPVYLGPAHPLIFDVQKRYGLGRKFFTSGADAVDLHLDAEMQEVEASAPPRYSSDLLFAYPFGAEVVEDAFKSAMEEWQCGVDLIAEAFGADPNERARMELNICRILGMHLRTAWNVARFYRARDSFFGSPGSRLTIDESVGRLTAILDDEIENAKQALGLMEDDFRIGYGYCYGQAYDEEMVRDKIRQCEYVRDVELPELKSGILFHVYQTYRPS